MDFSQGLLIDGRFDNLLWGRLIVLQTLYRFAKNLYKFIKSLSLLRIPLAFVKGIIDLMFDTLKYLMNDIKLLLCGYFVSFLIQENCDFFIIRFGQFSLQFLVYFCYSHQNLLCVYFSSSTG